MILDNSDNTDQNIKGIHSCAQRGGKNGVPLPGEPRRRPKNLVNPSIPKMEVLDACFENCIKENVSQQYIFKHFKRLKTWGKPRARKKKTMRREAWSAEAKWRREI